jgi:tetratricopeptide (TPR) repeat protein
MRTRPFFVVFLAVAPLSLLALLEVGLRLFSYEPSYDLVLTRNLRGRTFHALNRDVGRRYFVDPATAVPQPSETAFALHKPSGVKRIFCVGESTLQGFPYEIIGTAPAFLADRLGRSLRTDSVEVINVGLSAIGSTVVREFVDELLSYDPDLLILYVGHNEYYGAFGPGSAIAAPGGSFLTRMHLALLRFKTYVLLRDVVGWTRRALAPAPSAADGTLMEQMMTGGGIRYGSDAYREGLARFRENLEAIVDAAHAGGVPILVSTLVSNLRDQPPFLSIAQPMDAVSWQAAFDTGNRLAVAGDAAAAAASFEVAAALDSGHAGTFFAWGSALLKSGDQKGARRAFSRARDLDALRFRASEELSNSILEICSRRGVPIARVDSVFDTASPAGIVGHELILEHLHPNLRGYFLMAKCWADVIRECKLLGEHAVWGPAPSDSLLFAASGVTEFDEALGRVKVDLLLRRPPFRAHPDPSPYVPPGPIAATVFAALRDHRSWSEARYRLVDAYAQAKEFDRARRECETLARAMPLSFQPLVKIGDLYSAEGRSAEAEASYRRSLLVEESPHARMKLGLLLLQDGRAGEAAGDFEKGFALDARLGGQLTVQEQALGRFFLGTAYARLRRTAAARAELQRALELNPSLHDARALLNSLR